MSFWIRRSGKTGRSYYYSVNVPFVFTLIGVGIAVLLGLSTLLPVLFLFGVFFAIAACWLWIRRKR